MTIVQKKPSTGIQVIGQNFYSKEILSTCIPDQAIVALSQDSGDEARPLVKIGKEVQEGEVIGESVGSGSYVHAPISGRVSEISEITLSDGRKSKAITIDFAGGFNYLNPKQSVRSHNELEPIILLQRIKDAGLIHDVYSANDLSEVLKKYQKAKTREIVIDCLETIPYHHVDSSLIFNFADQIIDGIEIVNRIFGNIKIIIVLPFGGKKLFKDFIGRINTRLKPAEIVLTSPVFPAAKPEFLLPLILKTDPIKSANPIDVGVLLLKPRTLYALYEAVVLQKPLIEKFIALGGKSMTKPRTVKARIGTPIYQIIEDAGGLRSRPQALVANDPFNGSLVKNIDLPLTKDIDGIFAFEQSEISNVEASNCIQCGVCIRQCPVGLEPEMLYNLIMKKDLATAKRIGLDNCTNCGLCSFVCPSHLPLSQTFTMAKNKPNAGGN